jgi:transglutaminase-like putative cysteine protease
VGDGHWRSRARGKPLGLIIVREPAERAQGLAVSTRMQADLLQAAAVVPQTTERIDEPRDIRRLTLRLDGAPLSLNDIDGWESEDRWQRDRADRSAMLEASAVDPRARDYLAAEPLLESDDPLIRAEAEQAVRGATGDRDRAERLTRYVNGLLDKKPTVSLPSAREVLRRRSATATSTQRSSSRWRDRSASLAASRSDWCSCTARSTTTRGPRFT